MFSPIEGYRQKYIHFYNTRTSLNIKGSDIVVVINSCAWQHESAQKYVRCNTFIIMLCLFCILCMNTEKNHIPLHT